MGKPIEREQMAPNWEARYWEKVGTADLDECWEWAAAQNTDGYGKLRVKGHNQYAHRLAWELEHGRPVPEGRCICHRCDNPACVNPAHLFLGTQADNLRDMAEKGRARGRVAKGSDIGNSKLTDDDVREIRKLAAVGHSQRQLAARFGVGRTQIGRIVRRESWTWLEQGT